MPRHSPEEPCSCIYTICDGRSGPCRLCTGSMHPQVNYAWGLLSRCELHAGYEAPAQFAEETRNAARTVPWAIVTSVIATALCGGLHLAALLFSVQVRPASVWRAACILPNPIKRA